MFVCDCLIQECLRDQIRNEVLLQDRRFSINSEIVARNTCLLSNRIIIAAHNEQITIDTIIVVDCCWISMYGGW